MQDLHRGAVIGVKVVYYFSLKSNIVDKVDNLCMLLQYLVN